MNCSCQALESKYQEHTCKCTRYREIFPDCKCEVESVSEFSPGIVKDKEILVRTLYESVQVGRDGYETPLGFRNDVTKRGLSVDRLSYTDDNELRSEKMNSSKFSNHLEFVGVFCGKIRSLRCDDNKRLFCIYDSATEQKRYHADICQNVYIERSTENRKLRMKLYVLQLWSLFSKPQEFPSSLGEL